MSDARAVVVLAIVAGALVYLRGRIASGRIGGSGGPLTIVIDPPANPAPLFDLPEDLTSSTGTPAGAWNFAPSSLGGNPVNQNPRMISPAGLAVLKRHEGLSLDPYRDAAGHWTVGYGHKLLPGEPIERITQQQADAYLLADVASAAGAVHAAVKVRITQGQFDALVSFAYNVGNGAFKASTLLRKLNAGDYAGAADEFSKWVKAGGRTLPGLVSRREDEARLFLSSLPAGVIV